MKKPKPQEQKSKFTDLLSNEEIITENVIDISGDIFQILGYLPNIVQAIYRSNGEIVQCL